MAGMRTTDDRHHFYTKLVETPSGIRYSYDLGEENLDVVVRRSGGITMRWKGIADADYLTESFEAMSRLVCGEREHSYRSWLATEDGPIVFTLPPGHAGDLPPNQAAAAGFVRLDCVLAQPTNRELANVEIESSDTPFLSVSANIPVEDEDREWGSVSVHVPAANLEMVREFLEGIIVATQHHRYSYYSAIDRNRARERVRNKIDEIRSDLYKIVPALS